MTVRSWMIALPSTAIRTGAAISGLLLVFFTLVHLGGLIPAVLAPAQFEAYASSLHASPWLSPLEIGLSLVAVVHVSLTITKAIANRAAGNIAQLSSRRHAPLAALASRSKAIAGLLTLTFLVIHLNQLRWPRPLAGHEGAMLRSLLQQPFNTFIYVAAAIVLTLHLIHGTEAAHRSLGWLSPTNGFAIRTGGRLLAAVVGGGFLLISLALAFGVNA